MKQKLMVGDVFMFWSTSLAFKLANLNLRGNADFMRVDYLITIYFFQTL